ncbi:hypothetical protein PGH26_02935 [Sporosarcina jeotgali]|uniref:Gram-positive cocci surface proteins LPxTG domain-containing protein n=1 Tax=Sporosarcina jeotgali TaxID=3020056 RepID=A0ABZ0KWX4_9BACL|nr:hypothetical protein [Sporosarcina sp. B2O-1]WOV84895.1 hypothetical protein PGH26_02935 [Sporosarcina sp. B2O-1]
MNRVMVLVVAGSLVFGGSGPALANEDESVQAYEEDLACVALEIPGDVPPRSEETVSNDEGELKRLNSEECKNADAELKHVHKTDDEIERSSCLDMDLKTAEDPGNERYIASILSEEDPLTEVHISTDSEKEEESNITDEDDEKQFCSETIAPEDIDSDEGDQEETITDQIQDGEELISNKEEPSEETIVPELSNDLDSTLESSNELTEEQDVESVSNDDRVNDLDADDVTEIEAPTTITKEATADTVKTASVENSPIIQTEIEIDTITHKNTSSTDSSSQSSGNGDYSNSNDMQNRPDKGMVNKFTNLSSNHGSQKQEDSTMNSERLPQTGGILNQTNMLMLSIAFILAGAALRIGSSTKRHCK